jgi:integrase
MTKSEAREKLAELIKASRETSNVTLFGPFVEGPYFSFYSRKWKGSTKLRNVIRVRAHMVREFGTRDLSSFKRHELQDFLDRKANNSYSLVSKLRWDLKQIFDMAVSDGLVKINPALLLFTPRQAKKPDRRVLSIAEIAAVFRTLEFRERLIAKLATLSGMRPGEIFALRWRRIGEAFAKVTERVYEGVLDTPKSERGNREAALSASLLADLTAWEAMARDRSPDAFVFPSEVGTPLSSHNVWQRNMQPKLKVVGLGWANFLVMRRTFLTRAKAAGCDPKVAADQAGHDIGVSVDVYTQSTLDSKLELVNRLERSLLQ